MRSWIYWIIIGLLAAGYFVFAAQYADLAQKYEWAMELLKLPLEEREKIFEGIRNIPDMNI